MCSYPKKVYVIFPFNADGSVAGVYVGASYRVEERIKNHKNCHVDNGKQTMLHNLMRENGFKYCVLDTINSHRENYVEYDWMDFFEKELHIPLFNNQTGLCGADWHRLKAVAV